MSSTAPSLHFEVLRSGRFDGHLDDLFSLQHRIAFDMVTQAILICSTTGLTLKSR
jgi:hypothetical protein